ncbi:MAG: DUF1573 domain-containing protein [Planctomycetes bacterium]|nr:DUF1573 domain-containing protein [Planctomycetota bacterium]
MKAQRTIALIGCALALLSAPALAQEEPASGPRLRVGRTTLELPELIQGQTTLLEVELESIGEAPLQLSLVDVTCGCTVVDYPREPIPPGEQRTLKLRFDSTDKQGNVSVDVFLYSNDPTQHDRGAYCTRLNLRGEVGSHFRLRPRSAAYGEVLAGGEAQARQIEVNARGPAREAMHLAPREVPDFLEVSVEPGEDASKARILVKLLPSAPRGDLLQYLEFDTGVESQPVLRLPVVATITGMIRAPVGVDLRRIVRGAEPTLERVPLTLSDAYEGVPGRALPIHRLDYDRARLEVEVEHVSPRRADLLIRGRSDAPLGPFSAPIHVYFDLTEQPQLVVPVFGNVVGRVRCSPAALALGARELQVVGGTVLEASLEPALPGVSLELAAADGGSVVRLVGGELNADARLVLRTDVEGEERVVVEVLAAPK